MRSKISIVAALLIAALALAQYQNSDSIQAQSGGGVGGQKWVNAYDCDYTTQASATLVDSDAGSITVCGQQLWLYYGPGATTPPTIDDGGIEITPVSATHYNNQSPNLNFDAPYAYVRAQDVIANYTPEIPVRACLYITSALEAANFDGCGITFEDRCASGVASCATDFPYLFYVFREFNTSTSVNFYAEQSKVRSTAALSPAVSYATQKVLCVSYPFGENTGIAMYYTDTSSHNWNTFTGTTQQTVAGGLPTGNTVFLRSPQNPEVNGLAVGMVAERWGSATAGFKCTFARLRIDYQVFTGR